MPIYLLKCSECNQEIEKVCGLGETAVCSQCGAKMRKLPTYPAMVKIKGDGGYPSRRKQFKDTAAYTA